MTGEDAAVIKEMHRDKKAVLLRMRRLQHEADQSLEMLRTISKANPDLMKQIAGDKDLHRSMIKPQVNVSFGTPSAPHFGEQTTIVQNEDSEPQQEMSQNFE